MAIYGMMIRYYEFEDGKYKCLHCDYQGKSFMGIQTHIRKHKRELNIFPYESKSKIKSYTPHKDLRDYI